MKNIYTSLKLAAMVLLMAASESKAQTYCTAIAGSTADDEIFNVSIGTLNNTSNCSQTGGGASILNRYSDYTSIVTAPILMHGVAYPLSLTVGQCNSFAYSGYVGVWIDYNMNGLFTDPGEQVFMSGNTTFQIAGTIITGTVTVPTTLTGITRMRVIAMESGIPGPCTSPTWGEVEDYNVNIISAVPCSSVPGPNSINGPSASICPNASAGMGLATNYTVAGISYQWSSSTTSSVGPFVAIPNATNASYSASNLTVSTWFIATAICANVSGTTTATGTQVIVAGTTTNSVPYFEGFEGIGTNNQLPNCSWNASNISTNCLTYVTSNTLGRTPRTGSKFASFYYNPGGTRYFYTSGIQLEAGITYSAALWYQTEYYGYNNWTDLSILYGTTQSPTGLVSIASSNGPAISNIYKSLSNTFMVPSSGLYYIAIRGTGTTGSSAQYLTWDDLSITIPCGVNSPNTPSLVLSANTVSVCEGQPINITVSGADTYTWSNGSNGSVLTDTPFSSMTYMVAGTNSLTGCTSTISQAVMVSPSPTIYALADKSSVCAGSSAQLTGLGGLTYTWSTGAVTNITTVSPTSNTSYTVLGSNAAGCTSQAVQMINVNSLPNVGAVTAATEICKNETANLTASGALTYQWLSSSSSIVYQGTSISVPLSTTTTFTLIGTDANGCSKSVTVDQSVNECLGLSQYLSSNSSVRVFPNPTDHELAIETQNTNAKTINVFDLNGRIVLTVTSSNETVHLNLSLISNGVYYVKIQSDSATEVVKIVKN